MNYAHLKIRPGLEWWCRYVYSRILVSPGILGRAARLRVNKEYIVNLLVEEDRRIEKIALLRKNSSEAQLFGAGYGYADDAQELDTLQNYRDQLKRADFRTARSESSACYESTQRTVQGLLRSDRRIRQVLNFGVSYAYVDSLLAIANPDVRFLGIDRSCLTRDFNQKEFADIRNLEFVAGDIFDYLAQRRFAGGLFLTVRTLTLLPSSFIKKLYQSVSKAGFRYVVLVEPFGISRETHKSFEFSDDPDRRSVLFRGSMFLHNYPGLLMGSGFQVREAEFVKTLHPHEDFRLASLVASREG